MFKEMIERILSEKFNKNKTLKIEAKSLFRPITCCHPNDPIAGGSDVFIGFLPFPK